MKRKKIGLYDPYLDSIGGGEKHILSVLQVLEHEENYIPYIFWKDNITPQIEERLSLRFHDLRFKPDIFSTNQSLLQKLTVLKDFDVFIYVTDGSYFFSSAKKNYIFCMVPNPHLFAKTAINRLKTINYSFITNSRFTQRHLQKWGINSTVLYPYISKEFIELKNNPLQKEKTILVAGRFFEHLHSKRQDIAIEAFRKLKKNDSFHKYRLILAGSVLPSDIGYLDKIRTIIGDDSSIELYNNISFTELVSLYKKANYYWHFTGYGVDEEVEPEKVEHLGITPLEAMAAGCGVFCFNAGGPKEIIKDGENGFLFSSIDELIEKMKNTPDPILKKVATKGQQFVNTSFSYEHFKHQVLNLFT